MSADSLKDRVVKSFKKHDDAAKVADELKIKRSDVYRELREAGIARTNFKIPSTAFDVLADLINTPDTYDQIAAKHGISRQRVDQVQERATAVGIALHPQRKTRRKNAPKK